MLVNIHDLIISLESWQNKPCIVIVVSIELHVIDIIGLP